MLKRSNLVSVVDERCRLLASRLSSVCIPHPREDTSLPLAVSQLPNFYFVVVAICHQTSPVGGQRLEGLLNDGRFCFGWDYLRERWAEQLMIWPDLNYPSNWCHLDGSRLEYLLQDKEGKSTLSDADARASLLRDAGERLTRLDREDLSTFLSEADGRLDSAQPPGMYSLLETFRAYSDPIRKKSSFFLQLMRSECDWVYKDSGNLGPPVDYHEVRGHLRIGTVKIVDPIIEDKVFRGLPVSSVEDQAIRGAVYVAICNISDALGNTDPATLHYFFWNVFRRCCSRSAPHCAECPTECGLPKRYRDALSRVDPLSKCFFGPVCDSREMPEKLSEHFHLTEYY